MNNLPHSIILIQGSQNWDKWRKINPGTRPDLAGAALSGIDLRGIDLSSADLRGACISGSDLSKVDLTGAILTEADLSGALLNDAVLLGVFLTGALLGGADLTNADLREANLSGADLSGARLCGAVLRSPAYDELPRRDGKTSRTTTLTFGLFRGADLSRSDLRGVDLSGARLGGANLSDALLCRANLSGVDLRGANLSRADLSGANLYDANIAGANLTEVNLGNADLGGARVHGTTMTGALLRRTSLRGADCSEADLTDAVLLGTDLAGAILDGAVTGGVSCRDLIIDEKTSQANLVISHPDEPVLMVDTLEAAGLLQLLAASTTRDSVIQTISGKLVLLFGRLDEHRELLAVLAGELRQRGYPPLIADVDLIVKREYRDRLKRMTSLCRFAIGDLAAPTPFPADALAVFYDEKIPLLPLVPESLGVPPLLGDFGSQIGWIPPVSYREIGEIKEEFEKRILGPLEQKRRQMREILHNLEYLI
jgi:uncharacterized protein YjbI with pentapeptide repeats